MGIKQQQHVVQQPVRGNLWKKRKLSDEKNTNKDVAFSIQSLEVQLTAAVANKTTLNPLADLLDIARNIAEASLLSKALYALYRVFVVIISAGMLHGALSDDTAKAVRTWLNERLQGYTQLLVGLLKDDEPTLKTSSLNILMSLQKHLSTSVSKTSGTGPQWHNAHFKQVVDGLLACPPSSRSKSRDKKRKAETPAENGMVDAEIRDLFIEKWLSENDDVRWFFLRESAGILTTFDKKLNPDIPANLLSFLERLATFPTEASELNSWWVEELGAKPPKPKAAGEDEDEEAELDGPTHSAADDGEDDWRKFFEDEAPVQEQKKAHVRLHKLTTHQSLHSLGAHRAMFTRTWLSLLPYLSVGSEESKRALATRALNVMHRGVMPHLTRAILVMDWVGSCVDYGGSVGLLSLNALFILMKEYNLDYPSFYTRLYTFLDRDVLHLKHRARFFRMTELFLSSTHLPVTLLASFVKRLARLSLSAPPAAIVMIIPFTYNLLKKHPSLMAMIHREVLIVELDPFNNSEPNPTKTQAIDSSLWELYTHRQHYHSAVSTLAKIFSEAFTKPNYALEDFLDHTYSTLFDTEVKRRIKKEPALAMETTHQSWFRDSEQGDRVEDLWSFA
ncbi:CBF-domain-containing protein [Cristinia sonorae]|uniref:CBF-domain-containing protein n=1 Tax=Cristinia sonorae TaxID=1940300 RepID=A0A8K0UIP0_9AGAR|nr:CBF-domain-containing protein [Cristinia sonorae]